MHALLAPLRLRRCTYVAATQACVDQGEVVMMGEEYQYDVLHPAWAPGAVVPLPSFVPTVPYTPQYGKADSNGDFFSPGQPLVRGLLGSRLAVIAMHGSCMPG